MREQKTVQVQGEEYVLTQFGAIEGIKYQKALAKVLLPAFVEVSKVENQSQESAILLGMAKLAENLDQIDEKMIEAVVVRGATKGSMAINFDNEFAGNYTKLFELFKEIVMFNFGSVFTMFGTEEE